MTRLKGICKWLLLSLLLGCCGGAVGAGFHHALRFVTGLRGQHPWVIFLLPLGGLATVALYRLLKLTDNRGTNTVMDAALEGQRVPPQVLPGIFLATAITHFLGGSGGREGAALQLGGSAGSILADLVHAGENHRKILVMAGMSAVFAGLFGTPLTASVFVLEFLNVGVIFSSAVLPCYVAAIAASRVSGALGVQPEGVALETLMPISPVNGGRVLVLAILVALLGIAMCKTFHEMEHLAGKFLKNPFLRAAAGGVIVIAATLLIGDQRYSGAGMDMALKAVEGKADWYDFILKLLLTAITLAAGFKGGEIVPTFCIGATFGCVAGSLLGLDPGLGAALGLVGLFCSVTNAPIASIVLSVEMFGAVNLHSFALVSILCFGLSGWCSLYASQRHSRLKLEN